MDMETWNFDLLDDPENTNEPDYLYADGLHHDAQNTYWQGLLQPQYERHPRADDEAAQPHLFTFDNEHLTHDEHPERDLPVPPPYLERQRPSEPTFSLDVDDETTAHPTRVSTPTSYRTHEFISLEDTDSEDEEEEEIEVPDMPPTRRSHRPSVVDLTEGSPQQSTSRQPKRKRSATDAIAASSSRDSKRRKLSAGIEEIDLANEAPSAEDELVQAQQQKAAKAQALEDAMPQKIGQRSCIICLENFTNCTATACGHFFCHECLIQALRAAAKNSDRGTGSCPVCRKSLKENKKSDVIPISFMTKKEYDRLI